MDAMLLANAALPPELHPEAFPEMYGGAGPANALAAFNNEIRTEYLIMKV